MRCFRRRVIASNIELGAVAGRKNRRFARERLLDFGQRVAQPLDVKHHPLADRERRGLVIESEGVERHAKMCAKPADYKVLVSFLTLGDGYNSASMDTLGRIKDLASKEFSLDAAALDPAAPLDSLGIDSLSFIEFMFKIEEEFGVSVSDEDLKGIKTLGDLERHVAAALTAAGKA